MAGEIGLDPDIFSLLILNTNFNSFYEPGAVTQIRCKWCNSMPTLTTCTMCN